MAIVGDIKISGRNLDGAAILKRDKNTKIPKVFLKEGIVYKFEKTHIASRLRSIFEVFNEIHELADCIFPENVLYINSLEFGYTTEYLNGYKSINQIIKKDKMSLEWKKAIIYKIIKLIKKLHLYGIVHNDLHCSNVLTYNSDIKLIDFDQLKIKGLESSDNMFDKWLRREINYLNLLILSILYEQNLSYVTLEEQKLLIDGLNLNGEFKEYLVSCSGFNEKRIGEDLELYVSSVTRKEIVEGKNLVKSLKL